MPQQTLHTERLTLVPLADEHLEWEVELDSDPEVMRYLSGRAGTREEVETGHARRMAAAQKADGLGFWVGLVDDEFVGWWILQPAHGPDQPDDPGVADLGYRLLRRHWHKGLASEGARELVRYGFDDVGLDRIIAQTLTANVRSRSVMERVGLEYVRTFRSSTTAPAEGVEEGEVEYEMTREQWERRSQAERAQTVGERRWPMALAVVVAIVLTLLVPGSLRHGPIWLIPVIEGLLLGVLVFADPGRIDRRSRELRALSIGLVLVLVLTSLSFTAQLVSDLINGGPETNSAGDLLRAGAAVWVGNNIAFALLYWELDGGGSAARFHGGRAHPDLGFPQQLQAGLGWESWKPRFVDYLYLGFTNATAFSPTDVMPLVPWAKLTMLVQSLLSLAILSLVVARAVNVFT